MTPHAPMFGNVKKSKFAGRSPWMVTVVLANGEKRFQWATTKAKAEAGLSFLLSIECLGGDTW